MQPGIPRVASVTIDRLAVFDALDRATRITVITAPPGFGKTTTVARWLDSRGSHHESIVWIALPRHNVSATEFWEQVGDAVTRQDIGEPDADPYESISRHTGRVILVVDDADSLRDEPVRQLIQLARRADTVRIVLMARRRLAPQFSDNQYPDVTTIDDVALAFSSDETRELYTRCGLGDIDAAQAHSLFAGWPHYVHRAALSFVHSGHPEHVLDTAIDVDDAGTLADMQGPTAMLYAASGRIRKAAPWTERRQIENTNTDALDATAGALARGWLAVEAFDEYAAWHELRTINARHDTDELWAFVVELQTIVELLWGRPEYLLPHLVHLRSENARSAPPGSYAHTALRVSIANLQLACGHGTAADWTLTDAPSAHPSVVVTRMRSALLRHDWETAVNHELNVDTSTPRQRAEFAVLQAAALLALDRERRAAETLAGAMWLMGRQGLASPLTGVPKSYVDALVPLAGVHADTLKSVLTSDISWPYPEAIEHIELTESETIVLNGLARGLTSSAIAAEMFLSVNTIKTHTRTLYRKLGVGSRADALVRARKLGLSESPATSAR